MTARALMLLSMMSIVACSAGNSDTGTGAGSSGGGNQGGGTNVGASSEGGGFVIAGGGDQGGSMQEEVAEVFGHSASTLYRLDPDTKQVTTVGPFSGCSDVIDIALDKDSNLYGTTFGGLWHIDRTTAACTPIASGNYPNSLSFIPAGTLDPAAEALVGYVGDQYVRIDPVTGTITTIGSLGEGGLVSSGDIVSVKDGNTYLTVTGNACETDCLIEVNPVTGILLKNWGMLGYSAAYGIAFWAGSVYGFTEAGELFEVTFDNDVMMTQLITMPPNTSFWGAGSTTSAPPTPSPR